MSLGCLQLIRDGAVLVRNADDVMEAMAELLPASSSKGRGDAACAAPAQDPETPRYSVEEALIMTNLDEEGVAMDELVRLTKLPAEKVSALAMSLRIKGFVRFLPGNRISPLTAGR